MNLNIRQSLFVVRPVAAGVAACYHQATSMLYSHVLQPPHPFLDPQQPMQFKLLSTPVGQQQLRTSVYQRPALVQPPQVKNYVQKIYELKALAPVEFEVVSSKGPAHKPEFEMKLVVNSNRVDGTRREFSAVGVSKKQAKLNASKNALRYLTELEPTQRAKFLTEADVIEIKSIFLQELSESTAGASPSKAAAGVSFMNDAGFDNELFKAFAPSVASPLLPPPSVQQSVLSKVASSSSNPISLFTELMPCDAYQFDIVDEWGESHAKQFKIQLAIKLSLLKSLPIDQRIDLTTSEKVFYAVGNSKKQAKLRVAQIALETLLNLKVSKNPQQQSAYNDTKFKQFAESVSDLIKSKYVEYIQKLTLTSAMDTGDLKSRTVYAAVIQTNSSQELSVDAAKIICLTSGTKCINGEFMSQSGAALNDCHAEILACRLLRRYLYEQLEVYVDHVAKQSKQQTPLNDLLVNEHQFIFEMKDEYDVDDEVDAEASSGLFCLKENIKFHLFISTSPCGDGRIFAPHENHDGTDNHPNRKIRGLLRAKLESGEGTIPVGSEVKIQSWDGVIHGDRLKVMSCSDKLCKVNVVGVQGALLSHFIDTVYFDSVIIGSYYHYEHLSRALYGRVEEHFASSSPSLPQGFKLHKPSLITVTNTDARQISKASNKAYVWSETLATVKQEIINTKDGKQNDTRVSSSVCKCELFKCWKSVHKKLLENKTLFKLNAQLANLKEYDYSSLKRTSTNYQKVKVELYNAFKNALLGYWVTKPFEQDCFCLQV